MPWAHGDSYVKEKNPELKHLLRLRDLDDDGTKKEMASRLIFHDQDHPFEFRDLPVEVRFQIYILVATEDACEPPRSSRAVKGHKEGAQCSRKLKAIVAQPNLFRVCNQTRNEGLQVFYKHHYFKLVVQHDGCFLAIVQWLQNLRLMMRENIRHLDINYISNPLISHMNNMGRIHGELSDVATVSYKTTDFHDRLWAIGEACERQDRSIVPVFRIGGADENEVDERLSFKSRPSFRTVPNNRARLECSLVFLPGKSWFGPGGPRSVR